MARAVVPMVGLGSGLAAAVAVVFVVGSSTINGLRTELARAALGNIGPRSGQYVTSEARCVLPPPSSLLFCHFVTVSLDLLHINYMALY